MRQYGQGFLADRLADIEALKQLVKGKAPERDLAATLFRRDEELRVSNERILGLVRRVEELERGKTQLTAERDALWRLKFGADA